MLATECVTNPTFPEERRQWGSSGPQDPAALAARLPSGSSAPIRAVIGLIRQVAVHDSTVLVLGESGTGKEVAARAVHDLSPRRNRPFVAVNCGAIPAELLESELFGHEKGSFTGAIAARKGRFEIAEGGTLFLDEIGDMSPSMQVKLLRVLQERVFERVGNHTPIRCNVRVIAATHRNLEQAIERGTFREDLFHRLNVFPIEMPPLRARTQDLPALVREFVDRNAAEGRAMAGLSPRALAALAAYPWTGNVRELSNLIERLSILSAGGIVDVADLPAKYRPSEDWVFEEPVDEIRAPLPEHETAAAVALSEPAVLALLEGTTPDVGSGLQAHAPVQPVLLPVEGLDLREHLQTIERALVHQALERANGVVAHAARLLNLRRTTLVERLRKLGLADVMSEAATEV